MSGPPTNDTNDTELPRTGCLLGFDHGTVRVGVAVSDTGQEYAAGLATYTRVDEVADRAFVRALVTEYHPTGLLVGLPLHMGGAESGASNGARKFAAWLGEITGLPVAFHDERCTSLAADAVLRSAGVTNSFADRKAVKASRDKIAARTLLQTYLDSRRPESERADPGAPEITQPPPMIEPQRSRDRRKLRKERRSRKGW